MDALWTGSCNWPAAGVATSEDEAAAELRRGPWTVEEDAILAGYVASHGEGRWNELARAAGLRRTGKSCRLRWLNYLRPGVRRGDFTPREQLLILELHSRWGNRWSKISGHLPGRTDNEVKNYWRTRVQKHAKQLGCDVGSTRFHDVMRHLWMPRLLERIHADESAAAFEVSSHPVTTSSAPPQPAYQNVAPSDCARLAEPCASPEMSSCVTGSSSSEASHAEHFMSNSPIMAGARAGCWFTAEQCQYGSASATSGGDILEGSWSELLARACHDDADSAGLPDFELGETVDNLWSLDDIWRQQLY